MKSQNIEVEVGILEGRAKQLIEPFLIWQIRPFLLFKLAQTSNGKIGGGYLSSKEALIHVHKLRGVCSQMVIGGNTVRVDRPTLDCRLIGGKAPKLQFSLNGKISIEVSPSFQFQIGRFKLAPPSEIWIPPPLFSLRGVRGF